MRARWLWLWLPFLLAGCFQPASSIQGSPELELLPARRSERQASPGQNAAGALPLTIVAATPPGPTSPPRPTLLVQPVTGQGYITPGSPLNPVMETGAPTIFVPPPTATLTATRNITLIDERCRHTVRVGDTLYSIALRRGLSLEAMRSANPELAGDNPLIYPGQQLVIADCPWLASGPTAIPVAPALAAGNESLPTVMPPAPLVGTPLAPASSPMPLRPASVVTALASSPTPGPLRYTVRSGDSLYSIALRFDVSPHALMIYNNLENPDHLNAGRVLIIRP